MGVIDFRPTELDLKCREETEYHMSIRHRKAGVIVAGSGSNKFSLECELLEKLRKKLRDYEETDHATGKRRGT